MRLNESSKPDITEWRRMLIRSLVIGMIVTASLFFLLKDIEEVFYQLSIPLSIRALVPCIIGGSVVGLILPPVPYLAVASHSSLSTVLGSAIYFLIYYIINPPLLPNFFDGVVSNLFSSVIGGFIGGLVGSVFKGLIG